MENQVSVWMALIARSAACEPCPRCPARGLPASRERCGPQKRARVHQQRRLHDGKSDPVEGFFEIRGTDRDAVMLLNLLDDLEYRT